MRPFVAMLLLSACATSGPQVRRESAPDAVAAAERHVVAVYVGATCDRLRDAAAAGSGFYVNAKTVATAGHLTEAFYPLSTDYAVVSPDGSCAKAQYANLYSEDGLDLFFLRVHGDHEGAIPISEEVPRRGEALYSFSRHDLSRPKAASPMAMNRVRHEAIPLPPEAPKLPRDPFLSAYPPLRRGDSGSPVLNAEGEVVGMYIANAKDRGRPWYAVSLSGWVIKRLLAGCGPCEDDSLPE